MKLSDLVEKKSSKFVERPLAKTGVQPARLHTIVVTGRQPRSAWKGQEKDPVRQVRFVFELVNSEFEIDEVKYRHYISPKPFNLFTDEKAAIHKFTEDLDPENKNGGDLSKLSNTPCLVTVVHAKYLKDGKEIPVANLSGVSLPPEGFPIKELATPPVIFNFYNPDYEELKKLPNFYFEIFRKAVDYRGSKVEDMVNKLEQERSKGKNELSESDEAPY